MSSMSVAWLLLLFVPSTGATSCTGGLTIPHSNRDASNQCSGAHGDECAYVCDANYIQIGRHVCQHYEAGGTVFIDNAFYGGRCERLCAGAPSACTSGQQPVRRNSSDASGPCFATRCFASGDAALANVARGNYEAWRRAWNNVSGFYLDGLNLVDPSATRSSAATGVTGLGLIAECVGHAMGYQSTAEARARVSLTLRSLVGKTLGVAIPRDSRGFFAHFVDPETGAAPRADTSCLMCSGLLMAGALFASDYFAAAEVTALVQKLWDSIRFDSLLCSAGKSPTVDANGTGIPMTQEMVGAGCGPVQTPQADGFYQFNEEHYTVNFAFDQACAKARAAGGDCESYTRMWDAWQGRRGFPNHQYTSGGVTFNLLSEWSGYLVQLPFYTTRSFNSDATYAHLFEQHWKADSAFFNTTQRAGERGRYGLGAGPVPAWCTEGSGYIADRLDAGCKSHCRVYSPYVTAGYLPAAPDTIRPQLLELLADGEAVLRVPDSDYVVLWRKSMLDPGWPSSGGTEARLTMVDFSSELFGLSTLWLGADFYRNHSARAFARE